MAFLGAEKFSEFYITLHYIARKSLAVKERFSGGRGVVGLMAWNGIGLPLALRLLTHFIITRKLFYLTTLKSGPPLSSLYEEVLSKRLNK